MRYNTPNTPDRQKPASPSLGRPVIAAVWLRGLRKIERCKRKANAQADN